MKQNKELLKAILQSIDDSQKFWEVLTSSFEVEEIMHHTSLLNDEGFINGLGLKKCSGGGWKFVPSKHISLTISGHRFLSNL